MGGLLPQKREILRIAQVVTFISADGAFGGPVSVAKQQVSELARRGHDVTLFAGWDMAELPELQSVRLSLHPVRSLARRLRFPTMYSRSMHKVLRRTLNTFDIVHVHLGRDMVTLPAAISALASDVKVVVQTHGMVMPDRRASVRLIDLAATRRVLRRADHIAVLTEAEKIGIQRVASDSDVRTVLLRNGVREASTLPRKSMSGGPVVFCARLHPRKRVLAFLEMAEILIDAGVCDDFIVAGPDEGDGGAAADFVASRGLRKFVHIVGALTPEGVEQLLANAGVFVLPSEREPFPMILLEALSAGVPCVITDGCMIADEFYDSSNPVVTDGSPEALAAAVTAYKRDEGNDVASVEGRDAIRTNFSIESVVDRLVDIYRS